MFSEKVKGLPHLQEVQTTRLLTRCHTYTKKFRVTLLLPTFVNFDDCYDGNFDMKLHTLKKRVLNHY
jgi:hypothetical protein